MTKEPINCQLNYTEDLPLEYIQNLLFKHIENSHFNYIQNLPSNYMQNFTLNISQNPIPICIKSLPLTYTRNLALNITWNSIRKHIRNLTLNRCLRVYLWYVDSSSFIIEVYGAYDFDSRVPLNPMTFKTPLLTRSYTQLILWANFMIEYYDRTRYSVNENLSPIQWYIYK